jgi:hypothetical protein
VTPAPFPIRLLDLAEPEGFNRGFVSRFVDWGTVVLAIMHREVSLLRERIQVAAPRTLSLARRE